MCIRDSLLSTFPYSSRGLSPRSAPRPVPRDNPLTDVYKRQVHFSSMKAYVFVTPPLDPAVRRLGFEFPESLDLKHPNPNVQLINWTFLICSCNHPYFHLRLLQLGYLCSKPNTFVIICLLSSAYLNGLLIWRNTLLFFHLLYSIFH